MASQSTERKFDIFANDENANDGIRVGYIDSKRGYISGLSVYEANKYAERNPGTQFILATRDEVKYLNITGVNKLTNKSIIPKNSPRGIVNEGDGELDPCNTVRGFATDSEQSSRGDLDDNEPEIFPPDGQTTKGEYNASDNYKRYKKDKTRIELQGGGGIGALASPIIGLDGSIIHCRVIDGGFGYQFPPQVRIIDDNRSGSGAKAYSVLGTIGYTQENYDDEDDVEEYNFDIGEYNFDSTDASWGSIYNLGSQTVIGEWNPANVISLTNPQGGFADQLTRYLEFLKGYDPNKPWWTTRDESPVRVAGNKRQRKANGLGAVLFPVEHHAWGGNRELDDLFVDVEFEVYGQGTYKNRNLYFKFEAEDGSHSFRVRGVTNEKRSGKKRIQIASVKANTNYVVTSNVRKKIKNSDEMVLEQGLAKQLGGTREDGQKQRDGSKSKVIFADVVGSANDNDDIQVRSDIGSFKAGDRTKVKFDDAGIQNKEKLEKIKENKNNRYKRGTFDLTYRINRRKDKTFTTEITDSFMNRYAVCPELPSNVEGTDKAGIPYSLIYKEFFPHEGEYIFRGASDNIAEVFLDGKSIMDISNTFKGNQKKVKQTVTKGLHKIRIDLENSIQKKIVNKTYTSDGAKDAFKKLTVLFKVVYSGSARHRKIKCIFTSKTNPNESFTIEHDGKNNEVKEVGRAVIPNQEYSVQFVPTADRKTNGQKEFNIEFEGLNSANQGPVNSIEVSGNNSRNQNNTLKLRDGDGNDANAKFTILPSSPGVSAKFSDDGKKLLTKGNGDVTIRLKWDDNPKTGGVAVRKIKVAGKTWKQKGEKGEQTETINLNNVTEPFVLEQGIIKNGTKDKEGGRGSSNRIFADYLGSANDNDDMQIFVTKGGDFIASKKRKSSGESNPKRGRQTRSTFDLDFTFQDETLTKGLKKNLLELVENKTGQSLERSDIELTEVFDTKSFISKANRSLYRVESAVKFGDFFSRYAVTPFNPLEVDPEIIDVKPIVIEKPAPVEKPKVKFERKGGPNGDLFLKVIGTGKVKIGFKLKVDDSLITSGLAVRDVKIESDDGNINLKRNIENVNLGRGQNRLVGKEKEKIKGFGEFTGGKTYKVIASGGSSTSGFKTVDNTIVFDDDYTNGWDKNAGLEIDYVRSINEPKSQPPKPPKNGRNNSSKKSLDNVEGSADAYAGTHEIVWKDLNFPYDGIYNVDVQVDDNARIEIFNRKFQAQILDVKGFQGRKNVLQSFSLEVKKGKYTLRAFLVQIPGKSIVDGNPMGLAIRIKTASVTIQEEIILNKSWNANPFGAALTIHAPLPEIPQEPALVQDGPCPPNPIWTTRSMGFVDQWYPCSHRRPGGGRTWSKFMNRYAMSPVLPIGSKGSGYSGQQWTNSWDVNIPFTGFYNFKGTSDNKSSCTISQTKVDGGTSEVSQDRSVEIKKINHFRTEKKDLTSNKIFLEKGEAKIEITVQNGERIKYREVTRKVFNTSDWLSKPVKKDKDRIPVDFKVYGQGSKSNMEIKAIFKEKGGDHTFTINNVEKSKTTESIKKRVKSNTDYKVTFVGTPKTIKTTESVYPIEVAAPGTKGRGDKARIGNVERKKIRYLDEDGDDPNATLSIDSMSPGQTAKFSGDGKELLVKGDGDVTLKFKWDDDPSSAGKAVGELKVGGKTFRQSGEKGEERQTIRIGGGGATRKNITKNFGIKFNNLNPANNPIEVSGNNSRKKNDALKLKDGDGSDANAKIIIEDVKGGTAQFSDDGRSLICNGSVEVRITLEWDDNPNTAGVALDSFELGGKVWRQEGRSGTKTQTINLDATDVDQVITDGGILEQGCMAKGFGRADVKNEGGGQTNPSDIVFADYVRSKNDNNDMMIQCAAGIFTPSNKTRTKPDIRRKDGKKVRRGTWDLTYRLDEAVFEVLEPITEVDGATYEVKDKELSRKATTSGSTSNSRIIENTDNVILNPTLATYNRGSLGRLLSPFFPKGRRESGENLQGRTWEMIWEDVKFPIDGEYKFEMEVDDTLKIEVSEDKVELNDDASMTTKKKVNYKTIRTVGGRGLKTVNATLKSGKRNVKLTLQNLRISGTSFKGNPTVAACKITCKEPVEIADQRPWLVNPVGVSAVLISPPCDRVVGGGGTVTEVNIVEEGNSYPPPDGSGIPSQVVITDIIPDITGVGRPTTLGIIGDTIELVGYGTLPITKGPFGKITSVGIPTGGIPITRTPNIITFPPSPPPTIITKLIPDTPTAPPDTVIQVTDLAGLKQTGYIEGRAYYGEVFFKDGTPFAGRYETAGKLIQVYATLQESIDSEVTTRPSAIQRSGTDINSNNPRLNIPGTPNNLA